MKKLNNVSNNLAALIKRGLIKAEETEKIAQVAKHLPIKISKQMLNLINDINDPIAKQFVPTSDELETSQSELVDPIGDNKFVKVKGIIHRYPDRCLLLPIQVCPVYCRFCFRREKIGSHAQTLQEHELQTAINYIREQKNIWEVILTGGDPLILKPATIQKILQQIVAISHVEIIRIHTRVPVVTPDKITPEMLNTLKTNKVVYVVLHANHPKEFTEAAMKACAALIDAGIPMLSQTTLLNGINDNIEVLGALMRCFVKNRIKPYYLHQTDLAKGTKHFRTSIKTGQQLMKQLRGQFSGLCQPTYVLDIPGGHGKMPIGPNYLIEADENYYVEDYLGHQHEYAK